MAHGDERKFIFTFDAEIFKFQRNLALMRSVMSDAARRAQRKQTNPRVARAIRVTC